jgi:tRNA/tmRNA/rRNA uracil-C5-methylase (TrmA/RlmC/RlmD family)
LLPLLANHYEGSGVERNENSILAARAACQDQHLSGKFFCADAMSWVKEQQRADFDLVIVDAPRAGLKEGAQHVAQLAAEHVVVFSCNPKTLLRDLTALTQAGYRLKTLSFFDMFAYTDHLELAVWLSRD